MNNLQTVTNQTPIEIALGIDEKGMTTAKKLYEFLELNKSNYSKWCKTNILENEFAEEGTDYTSFVPNDEREKFNPNPTTDYKLTAKFAKKLSMTAKNERGEQARDYFIKAEDKLKEVATGTPSGSELIALAVIEAQKQLVLLSDQNKQLETEVKVKDQLIGEMKPKTTYYDLVLQSNNLMPVSLIAKDYGMGAQTLNKKLHYLGVQYNQSGTWLLYSKYQGKGYTQSKTSTYQKNDGTPGTKLHTQWTQQGRLFIYELLRSQGIVPTVEMEDKQ